MKIRTTLSLVFLTLLAAIPSARSQGVILSAGQTWSYHFTSLDYDSTQEGTVGLIHGYFSFTATDLTPTAPLRSQISWQLSEGMPSDSPFSTGGWPVGGVPPAGIASPVWLDLEGSVTFSAVSGTTSIDSLTFTVYRQNQRMPATYDIFETRVTLIPEPTVFILVIVMMLAVGFWKFVSREPQPNLK